VNENYARRSSSGQIDPITSALIYIISQWKERKIVNFHGAELTSGQVKSHGQVCHKRHTRTLIDVESFFSENSK
jgi:hypothetical protein